MAAKTIEERFWAKIEPEPNSGCWLWTGAGSRYGDFLYGSRVMKAHRVAWLMYRGDIPPGLELDHLCRVTLCVNPQHCEAVTHRVNTRRGLSPRMTRHLAQVCRRGHPYSDGFTYIRPDGYPEHRCRICNRQVAKAWRTRRGAA